MISILDEAKRLVRNDRQSDYDHPLDNYSRLAKVMTVIMAPILKDGCEVNYRQAILCQEAVKLVREAHRAKEDNRIDGAGYWDALQWAIEEEEVREEARTALSRYVSEVPDSDANQMDVEVTDDAPMWGV